MKHPQSSVKLRLVVLALIAALQSLGGNELPDQRNDLRNSGERNRDVLVQSLAPALKPGGGAGRLYARAECWTKLGDGISFPRLELQSSSKEETGLAAIQDILRKNKEVTVAEGRSGIVGIWIGNVSKDLLETKIRFLMLDRVERYNVWWAISAIIQAKEVEAQRLKLGMEDSLTIIQGRIFEPAPGLRHLSASMKDVTVDEALDRVAQAFGGLVIYRECISANGTRLFSVDFVRIADHETRVR